jgi:hypothetical protein
LGYSYLATIWGNDFTAIFDPTIADTVSYGFLAVSPSGELVTVIRGTDTILEWVDDAQFYFVVNPVPGGRGHSLLASFNDLSVVDGAASGCECGKFESRVCRQLEQARIRQIGRLFRACLFRESRRGTIREQPVCPISILLNLSRKRSTSGV